MEYPKEHGENGICRYGLASIQSCKACLFDVLCHLERTEELRKKEEVNNKSTNVFYRIGEDTHTISERAELFGMKYGKTRDYLQKHGERIFKN